MAETWPNISTLYNSLEETNHMPAIRTPFESGKMQTRARFTAKKAEFIISWVSLSNSDYELLKTFFNVTVKGGGESFNWTHPDTTVYECRFTDDELKFISAKQNFWKGKVKFREV